MNYRKKVFIMLLVMILLPVILSLLITLKEGFACNNYGTYSCFDYILDEKYILFIITPLFISASLLFIAFFSERVFKIWKKFAVFAIPLMLLGILLVKVTPNECDMMFCVDRTFMIYFSGILYLILSILVTTISAIYFKIKNKTV